ncbi:hypothetical protein GJ496_008751 [Pomphorhynchus laevis]|nr:hypothetical protein GJ496_008751 [Pomphorhynchus laevis]
MVNQNNVRLSSEQHRLIPAFRPLNAAIERCQWYLDDGIIGGSPQAIAQSLNTLSIDFLTLKLHLHWSKTEIIGVPDAIQISSNLCHSSPANNTIGNFQLLGSPIGSTDFIKDVLLRDLLPRLMKEIEVIANLPDPQSAYLLLRHCASAPKIGHLMRTISPLTLRASQLTVSARIQASLPFRLGGFGLRNTTIHSSNAFVTSVRAVSEISSREPNQYVGFEGALSELSVLTGKDNL